MDGFSWYKKWLSFSIHKVILTCLGRARFSGHGVQWWIVWLSQTAENDRILLQDVIYWALPNLFSIHLLNNSLYSETTHCSLQLLKGFFSLSMKMKIKINKDVLNHFIASKYKSGQLNVTPPLSKNDCTFMTSSSTVRITCLLKKPARASPLVVMTNVEPGQRTQ